MKTTWLILTGALVIAAFTLSGGLGLLAGIGAVIALSGYFFTSRQTKSILKSGAEWYISDPKRKEKAKKWIHKSSD
jgi:hypothetical protein